MPSGGIVLPPHWPKNEPFPWPEWEATCPRCGRFHRHYHLDGWDLCSCAHCGWKGEIKLLEVKSGT